MKRTVFVSTIVLFISLIACAGVWAQATAQISGTARDQSGAVLPGVEVKVTQTETGIARTAVTNEPDPMFCRTWFLVLIGWKRLCPDSGLTYRAASCCRS